VVDIQKYSRFAIVFLIFLRVGLGWQLLYEGLWKINSLSTPYPWSSEGYLKNSQGPMRKVFRAMTGDPDGMNWLDPKLVGLRWDSWKQRFATHYKLSESQQSALSRLIDGSPAYAAALESLPTEVDFKALNLDKIISYDQKQKRLNIDGGRHMLPSEKQAIEAQVEGRTGPEYEAYRSALNAAYTRAGKLSYKEKVRAHLQGDPDNAGLIDGRISQLQLYNEMLVRYEGKLEAADLPYQFDHLNRTWSDVREKGTALAGPVVALDRELQEEAMQLLTVDQVQLGPPRQPLTALKVADSLTIAGLTGLGLLLIFGLFTRFASLSAAFMVFGFYMAMPPLPGVPDVPGPEHSFIVNKNLIEVMALLALAFIPTGKWFGLDCLLPSLAFRKKARPS
jgi:uncharacterized membrane protein YphA (DoxX/SURF4 family)